MSYKKYYIYKEQISFDNGVTWIDTGQAIPSGDPIGTYETLGDCEGDVPPTPTGIKYSLTLQSGVSSFPCDGSTIITNTESRYFPNNGCLYAVDIGDCVRAIDEYVFHCCTSLSSATIPDSVISIGDWAFDSTDLLMINSNTNGICNLPKYLEHIGARAFGGSDKLTKINIPDSVTFIGNSAFTWCTSLTSVGYKGSNASVEIPNNITSLSESIFSHCSGLTSVNIPSSVRSIGRDAFWRCESLTSVTINATTPPTLGSNAFAYTNNCTIYVPCESVETYKTDSQWSGYANRIHGIQPCYTYRWVNMDASTDYYCEGTTKYYKQKKQVSYDEGQTWQDVTPPEYQKGDVAETESTDCGYVPPIPTNKKLAATYTGGTTREVECNSSTELTSGETRPSGYQASAMTSAVIGNCVTSIGELAFSACTRLTSCTIPNSVTSIGNSAFTNCRKITNIVIPDGVTSIGDRAFQYCSGLTSMNIPSSITNIGKRTFDDCTSLTTITVNRTTPPTLGNYAFDDTSDCPIYVPASSVNAYKTATNWSRYTSRIQAIP